MSTSQAPGHGHGPTPRSTSIASSKVRPTVTLTTFPQLELDDEPEQGILPSLLSRVKNTFASASASTPIPPAGSTSTANGTGANTIAPPLGSGSTLGLGTGGGVRVGDKGSASSGITPISGATIVRGGQDEARTEAQRIAEAVKNSRAAASAAAGPNAGGGHARKASGSLPTPPLQTLSSNAGSGSGVSLKVDTSFTNRTSSSSNPSDPSTGGGGPSSSSPIRKQSLGLKPPLPIGSGPGAGTGSSSSGSSLPPSINSQASSIRKLPIDSRWKPRMAPSTSTVTPVTSVTHSVAHKTSDNIPMPGSGAGAGAGPSRVPFPHGHRPPSALHASHTSALNPTRSSHNLLLQHAQSNRARRSSIATLPDSPTSTSHMTSGSAELSQNRPFMGGFSLGNEDSRSVRSVALGKKGNQSVSRIIRRLRGEGLSKHYWMADEHCKECYDCKSVFTAWRRKHHCRICGQIFCGRCAATIIDARRFGQEGSIRVCNLCLRIMEEYKEDEDDDRRSIRSLASARLPSFSGSVLLDKSLAPDLENHARSPFAASQLFAAQADEGLDSIEEGSVPRRWRGEVFDFPERPDTPLTDDEEHVWAARPSTAAPFRRPMDEDAAKADVVDAGDHHESNDPNGDTHQDESSPSPSGTGQPPSADGDGSQGDSEFRSPKGPKRVGFPRSETMQSDMTIDGRIPLSRMSSGVPLIGLRTRLSSRASQGGLTTLVDSERPEGLWRTRSHSVAQRPEALSGVSLAHFHTMLQQMIARAELPHPEEWHRVLSRLLLKVSTNVNPDVPAGDSMDVRAFVKIKKVPGGKINDSEYVDGVVITKNVAHKAMPRRLVNPRIMLLTFPLDYNRVENQFMSLEPIIRQERDYLRLLTKRIIDVRPHIVLVERAASRIALDYLLEANIAVARNVKLTAIQQVARCTQADVVAMDRLALEPRLGRCAEFQIQSFEHALIPGRRKTLMRFEGCPRDHGCTIILRGGDIETLRKVKVVADFMSLVAFHLKNEAILYNDEHNILPPTQPLSTAYQEMLAILDSPIESSSSGSVPSTPSTVLAHIENDAEQQGVTPKKKRAAPLGQVIDEDEDEDDRAGQKRESARITKEIALALKPYLTTALSASAAIRFPPPASLAKVAELDRLLAHLRQSRDEEEAAQILQEETKPVELPKPSAPPPPPPSSDSEATPIPSVVVSDMSDASATTTEPLSTASTATSTTTTTTPSPLPTPVMTPVIGNITSANTSAADAARDPYRVLRNPEEIAKESALISVEHDHAEHVRSWEWSTRKQPAPLRPEDFQNITFLSSMGCEGQEKPCVEPKIEHIVYYAEGDFTVGQYLEKLAVEALQRCPSKTCERLWLFHFRLLVHGDRRLQIAMDQFPCPSPGHEDCIITWSYCRQCGRPSPTTIIREEMWRMSWGTYLEHCFYPPEGRAGFVCPHDAYRDQIRYFAYRNLAIRIHNENIDIYEPVRPSVSLQVKVETRVILKNREYQHALQKNTAFFDSVLFRLRGFDHDIVQPAQVPQLKASLEALLARAVGDREEMVNLLNRTYKLTPMTDSLALNSVLRTLQDKVVQWDDEFVKVEKSFMPSEKDLKQMTASHLKKLFPNQEVFNSLDRNVAGSSVAEADEKETKSSDEDPPSQPISEMPTPATGESSVNNPEAPPPINLDEINDDAFTPGGILAERRRNPFSEPTTPGVESDSTISAFPRGSSEPIQADEGLGKDQQPSASASTSSEIDTDTKGATFVSRLPRRTKPSPNIADIVKRFQDTDTTIQEKDGSPVARTTSSRSLHRSHSHRVTRRDEVSDSDAVPQASRPRIRRGKTEQTGSQRSRDKNRPELASDAERSYAHNASRLLQPNYGRQATLIPERPGYRRTNTNPSPTPSGRTTPERSTRMAAPPMSRRPTSSSIESTTKPRVVGKGKAVRSDTSVSRTAPSLSKATTRRILGTPGTRVTSIARHFDRLQREAERERQKRVSMNRNKRARPVTVTKAKVQVFDNVRDAFRDEFDTDSSEADNEEDNEEEEEQAGYESTDSRGMVKSGSPTKSRQTSPKKRFLLSPPALEPNTSAVSLASDQSSLNSGAPSPALPISTSVGSAAARSGISDHRSEMSFTDRLQIELPSFETSAPLPSMPVTPHLSNTDTADEGKMSNAIMSQVSDSEMSSGGGLERNSIIKTLTGLWAFRAGDFSPLEYPLSAAEHLFADSRVIIRENEPTSIIAFALSSKTYRDKMKSFTSRHLNHRGQSEAFMPEDVATDRASTWDIVSVDDAMETDDPTRREGGTHLKYDFESGSSTIFCRIFFAEQFAALRSACDCEDSFVESLARCVSFDAAGGKSGSAFLKTKDDRFIAKEISRLEMDALTKFAPAYFEYTRKAFRGQRPSVLAKIYGFFKIGYRNAITGRSMKMNVLIMENLFYDRRFSKIYDLKGSTRNRLIQPTGRVNEVLLDENLMELVYKHPLYLREHSKRMLRSALFNDTLFLSNLNVMDYSLVVGVDSEKKELVVGIVDYIRTFTWDKKLESWVKDSAFLGGAGKGEPTIVTPKQYKTRFRTAMERFYFPSVPDRWTQPGGEEIPIDDDTN